MQGPDRLHWDLTERIIGVYHDTHYELGSGFLESVCQRALVLALRQAGLDVVQGESFTVTFRGFQIGYFVTDIVVNGVVLVEVKSGRALEPRHKAQVINYLRVSPLEVALLLNFGPKREFERLVFTNERKKSPVQRS